MSDTVCIRMSDDCTLRAIRPLHGEITAALASTMDLVLDCADVARADIAFVQLVVSAARTAERQAKRLTLVEVPAIVESAFARAGLARKLPSPKSPFTKPLFTKPPANAAERDVASRPSPTSCFGVSSPWPTFSPSTIPRASGR